MFGAPEHAASAASAPSAAIRRRRQRLTEVAYHVLGIFKNRERGQKLRV